MTTRLALLACLLTGCVFYADDDPIPCDDVPELWNGLRNPETGACEDWGGGGCWPEPQADIAYPDWAACPGACEGLDETGCLAAEGCRAAYDIPECPPLADCTNIPEFRECWGMAPSGPWLWESCAGLDAHQCSTTDYCMAVYAEGAFAYCGEEPNPNGCYADDDCLPGYECTAATECEPPPGCGADGQPCPDVCWGRCVPVDDSSGPGTCDGEVACDALPPSCPEGTVPGIADGCWTGWCIPVEDCDPNDPGECFGEVACDEMAPACPGGTVPGVRDGCYTGYCIPLGAC